MKKGNVVIRELKEVDGIMQLVESDELTMMSECPYEINEGQQILHNFDINKLISDGAMSIEDIFKQFKQENGIR